MQSTRSNVSYFRNFIFGVEDSLVSTVGLLSGIAIAGVARDALLVTGTVLICVEAISMAAGSFLSESSAETWEEHSDKISWEPYVASFVMFASYFVSGFIPLFPYIVFEESFAFWTSIGASLGALVVLGFSGGRISRTSVSKSILRMLVVGGAAIAVGVAVGRVFGL
ncbi:VIT1/CCC1 transporter family protein [Candidatus Kaiserbacteria bacterium]|nr:VIT1/CCC1 transporter family protein [Candidatus Kaiserbacteria bacterium]